MKELVVEDILKLCQGTLLCGNRDQVLENFCTDTRKLKPGDVYVGIQGDKFDGNTFYQEAINKGASVCILEHIETKKIKSNHNKTIVLVKNSITCLQKLAQHKREMYDIPVVAITGSVGKTSTKDMIYSVISTKYKTHKTLENLNNHIGVPLTILGLKDHEALVIELGMNHAGELSLLTQIVEPTIAVITNVGTTHIENLGTRENILKAKLEILEGLKGNQVVLNNDNDLLYKAAKKLSKNYQVTTIGIHEKSDYQAENIREDNMTSTFDIVNKTKNIKVEIGGEAFIYNALVAYAIGEILKVPEKLIKTGIASFTLSSHRLEKKVSPKGVLVIDDSYNANYDSMKASLDLLGKVSNRRKIAILGDMLELGEYTTSLHRQLGDIVYENRVDILITVGEYSQEIIKRVVELGMSEEQVFSFKKENETYDLLKKLLQKDDVVLVKASHSIHLLNVVNTIMAFK